MNIGIQQLLPNTPAHLAAWVHNAPSFKPGSHMPAQSLNNADLTAIVTYLESLK
jgi:cytochrome c1